YREIRYLPERPALAQKPRVRLDKNSLHRAAAMPRNQSDRSLKGMYTSLLAARTFRKQQQLAATLQLAHSLADNVAYGIVGNIACHTSTIPEHYITQHLRLHDAHHIRQTRNDQQRIKQRGMVGRQYHTTLTLQPVQLARIKTEHMEKVQNAKITAIACSNGTPDIRLPLRARHENRTQCQPGRAEQHHQRQSQ